MSQYPIHTVRNADMEDAIQDLVTACGGTNCEVQLLGIRVEVDAHGQASAYKLQGQQSSPNDRWIQMF